MPVWGPLFSSVDQSDAVVNLRMANLTKYLKSLQVKWTQTLAGQTAALQPDDNDVLWDKVYNGLPLTEAEIARLK